MKKLIILPFIILVCFTLQTRVSISISSTGGKLDKALNNNFIPIENVKVNDKAWTCDTYTKEKTLQTITKTFVREADTLVNVWLNKELIQTTAEHPFFTPGLWKPALSLKEGDEVLTYNGTWAKIDSIYLKDTTCTVYNFEVEGNHNYYVGNSSILVHNTCSQTDYFKQLGFEGESLENVQKLFNNSKFRTIYNQFGATVKEQFLKNFNEAPKALEKFGEQPGLIESWKVLQGAPDAVRRNTSVLDEVAKLRTKTLANGEALDVQKLFDNGFGNTLNSLSDADKTKMLARMNEWDASKVDDLARRLGKTTDYPNIADDLADPEMFKLYDEIVHHPEQAYELAQGVSDANLNRVAKSSFFQKHIKLGKELDERVVDLIDEGDAFLDELASFYGISRAELDDYLPLNQLQINLPDGNYMVADNAFVKKIADKKYEIYINEVKLSGATSPTSNQTTLKNSFNGGKKSFTSRSTKFGAQLPKDSELIIKKISKTHCDGTSTGTLKVTNL